MEQPATQIARLLAERAEDVCRHFLSNGRREGHYWLVGDASNSPGRSLYLRLVDTADGRGRAGKWTDAQNGDHGDLLDIIAAARSTSSMRETLDKARRFLRLPAPAQIDPPKKRPARAKSAGTPEAARKLFAASGSIAGTIVAAYLRNRAITALPGIETLRCHPCCWYRPSEDDAPGTRTSWPAMIAAVTDDRDQITGVHRTWLEPARIDKAPIADPRRAMGHLLGQGVRFDRAGPVMAFGEGLETTASLRLIMPAMPMIAGLSAAHLAAIVFPAELRRLYVARDDDPAGTIAMKALSERAEAAGIECAPLGPRLGDFNEDLRLLGTDQLRAIVLPQLIADDGHRFIAPSR